MNILTFDIEEWFFEKKHNGGREIRYRQLDDMIGKVLYALEEQNVKATFFCLGKLAVDFPTVVKTIADRGHEIGCHSNEHIWLNKMTEKQLMNDTLTAISSLEDVTGQKVVSYRAPAFTITEQNLWTINVLSECGIVNDASIFPSTRAFGGFNGFPQDTPCIISHEGSELKEFPICLTKLLGKTTAYSGGGYFRVLPYWLVSHTMQKRDYNICYFHLNDLLNQNIPLKGKEEYEKFYKEPGTLKNRMVRYIKTNIGNGDSFSKFCRLLSDQPFVSIKEADKVIDWEKGKKIIL